MRTIRVALFCAVILALPVAGCVPISPAPATIPLPNGFAPEGIAIGPGSTFYTGSLAGQGIYKGDVTTGSGAIFAEGTPGQLLGGIKIDEPRHRLYVAGGPSGNALVYDTSTGENIATYNFAEPQTSFINDVILTDAAAYFSDSFNSRLFAVPLGADGSLPAADGFETLPLVGDWSQVDGFNANGMAVAPDGKTLIVVNSTSGMLYTVNPETGEATQIDLGGATVTNGDGILLDGQTLYVVRNQNNEIVPVTLSDDLSSGEVAAALTNPALRVPTTIASLGNALYAVNARFDVTPGPDVDYDVVRVEKP